jgi:hypothetical protein
MHLSGVFENDLQKTGVNTYTVIVIASEKLGNIQYNR